MLIPFWTKKNAEAASEGVKIAFEAHPGFTVYNTETILKLRDACGTQLGANLDPSHFFWQNIDPVEVIKASDMELSISPLSLKDSTLAPR